MLSARISLNLYLHFFQSFIATGRSSGLDPVSSHSCCMYVRGGRPAFARPYVGVHRSTSLMSSSLLLQQCPACLVRLFNKWVELLYSVSLITTRNTYVYKNIRLYFYSWRWYLCGAEKHAKELSGDGRASEQLYIHIYIQKHNDAITTSGHSTLEKYTSHFIERVVCERELETE